MVTKVCATCAAAVYRTRPFDARTAIRCFHPQPIQGRSRDCAPSHCRTRCRMNVDGSDGLGLGASKIVDQVRDPQTAPRAIAVTVPTLDPPFSRSRVKGGIWSDPA